MSSLDTLARRAVSQLESEISKTPVPQLEFGRPLAQQRRRRLRSWAIAVAVALIAVSVPFLLGNVAPEEPVSSSTTIPAPTTVPGVQSEGELIVETSLGTWRWVRDDGTFEGFLDTGEEFSVELPDPSPPMFDELVWPQIDREIGGIDWQRHRISGHGVSFEGVTIVPAALLGHIDWNLFYTNADGWVEGRWRPLEGDCPWPEFCATERATLEILAVREETIGGGVHYPVDGVLDVLVASIVPGDPAAVEFRDQETGGLVLRLEADEAVSAQQLLRAGQGCLGGMECGGGLRLWNLYVEGFGWVEPPWHDLDMILWQGIKAETTEEGLLLIAVEGTLSSSRVHAWGSSDGVNWEELAPPYNLGDALANGLQTLVTTGRDLVVVTPGWNPEDAKPARPTVLRLVDGAFTEYEIDFSPLGPGELQHLSMTPWGWMAVIGSRRGNVWVSAQGTEWERIAPPDDADLGETVNVFQWRSNPDGSGTAEGSVPTPADSIPARRLTGSQSWAADDGSVYLVFEHVIPGTGSEPDFFYTSWFGSFLGEDERGG